jgi:lambda repressor-like predicted transcriptional regulator
MQPALWQPPVELSAAEQAIVKRIRRAKLFIFLRRNRHVIFDEALQKAMAGTYADSKEGQAPIPPAQLGLAVLLQAYTGVSDDEVIEACLMDRRWQVVLDCLECAQAPFSKGTFIAFRERLIAHQLDRRLIERTVQMVASSGEFGSRQLRAALDSSPLWGAGRVEDTYNLLGHALRKALGVMARQQGRELAALAAEAGAGLVAGSSLKAALDRDWDDPQAQAQALVDVLTALEAVEGWLTEQPAEVQHQPVVQASLTAARQIEAQDVVKTTTGSIELRQGVAPERRISIEDEQMRHGRKSKSQLIDGYKRHVLRDLDSGLVRAVGITPANQPEALVTEAICADLAAQGVALAELHIDRAYLSSTLVKQRPPELAIYCKAWPVQPSDCFTKEAFALDWARFIMRCPNGIEIPFIPGETVHFPAKQCQACPLRAQCTSSQHGRTVSVHEDEALLAELRQRQLTAQGRAKLRERIDVEHSLAHIGFWQGWRARYRGPRKNLFDLRRCAVVNNLHELARQPAFASAA